MLPINNIRVFSLAMLAVITVILVIVMNVLGPNDEFSREQLTDYPNKRKLSFEFRVQNMTPRPLKMAEVRAYVSASHTSTQLTTNIEHTGGNLITDGLGNKLMLVKYRKMNSGDSAKISLAMELLYRDKAKRLHEPMIDLYRQNDVDLGKKSEKLKAIVMQVKGDSAQATVENILNWMRDYSSPVEERAMVQEINPVLPTENSLINVFGKHDESLAGRVSLFVALCRAAGLPARGVVGAILDGGDGAEVTKFAIWPEYFFENVWHVANVSNTEPLNPVSNYIALRTIDDIAYIAGMTAESYLFETVSVNIVPGSAKLRVSSNPS